MFGWFKEYKTKLRMCLETWIKLNIIEKSKSKTDRKGK
jgi:hypothetical protein